MNASPQSIDRNAAGRARAFSLIEIMVTVGLLSFIILGLVMMFGQTQRAFTTSMAQVDVLESGRALGDMLGREMAEATPSHEFQTINFFSDLRVDPFLQGLPNSSHNRTNVLERLFFLTRRGQEWSGIGYYVVPLTPGAGVGTLYRYESNVFGKPLLRQLSSTFANLSVNALANNIHTTSNRLAQGVVHFKAVPLADNAFPLVKNGTFTNAFYCTNQYSLPAGYRAVPNTHVEWNAVLPGDQGMLNHWFLSNAAPAFVDLEIGVLEPPVYARYKSIPTPELRAQFLSNRVAQVHIFRQRVQIRNADLSVYQ